MPAKNEPFSRELMIKEIVDGIRRTIVHYGLWFSELVHHMGVDAAVKVEQQAGERAVETMLRRLLNALNIDMEGGVPLALAGLDREKLEALHRAVAENWLAVDGEWLQAVEDLESEYDAAHIHETCWSRFTPYEAARIRTLLDLPPGGGLLALKKALPHRLFARLNAWDISEASESGFTLRMLECRVQTNRHKRGLPQYACKTGGLKDFKAFALSIDPSIEVRCLSCPPDASPDEGACCAWRFEMPAGRYRWERP
jgi:hypothetical protein